MKTERVKLADLTPDPGNVRKHNQQNLNAIKASLQRFGQQHPIIVDQSNVIRAGNGRFVAMRALGWTECDVVRTSLEGPDAVAFAIADNRTAELATWDDEALMEQLAAIATYDEELLKATGYSASDLDGGDTIDAHQMPPMEWKIVIDCESEEQQAELMERLEKEGVKCQPLMS
jgi:ParB-like chromosome segregation protein Spo0J